MKNTTYTTIEITIGKTVYNVTKATGASNYVNVFKVTNNPWKSLGKDFADFDEAISNYKNPKMKVALINFENDLNKVASV